MNLLQDQTERIVTTREACRASDYGLMLGVFVLLIFLWKWTSG